MPIKDPPRPGDFIRTEIIDPAGLSVTAAAAALQVSRPAPLQSPPQSVASLPPALLERAHQRRLNQQQDVLFACVVRADERPEDRGRHMRPVVVL